MFPGMNPKKMQQAMKQMGINQEDIPASRVIIEQEDKNLVIENPSIQKITMQGQESFQITGDISEEEPEEEGINKDDIKTVAEKTNKSEDEAKESLEKNDGDLAASILELSE
ncbi:MAG: nascent polypeptide-associated complex protein [Nanoarchaeota archaeon]|nr:nascent polypeptide-associated complex protein [Nanoarchaeota archaeon]